MSNTLQLQQVSTTDIMNIAKAFSDSGMFPDIKTAAQAAVKIQAGKEFGIQPFASMSGIHIIQGKPTIGAGLMAARVKGFGKYDYLVRKHDDKICEIEYFEKTATGKQSLGISTFTIDEAKKAGTKNMDKFPKNMLFARAMSNGVKWYTPDIYETPVYVPEEMEHLTVEAEVIQPDYTAEIASAIDSITACDTVDELKELRDRLPSYVVTAPQFKQAAKSRYELLTKPAVESVPA